MVRRVRTTDFSRRRFIKDVAMSACALSLNPRVSFGGLGVAERPTTIGVLSPLSTTRSRSGVNLIKGLRVGFEDRRFPVRLAISDIRFGIEDIVRKSRELIANGNVDLLVGLINPLAASGLENILGRHKTPFIAINSGECISPPTADNAFLVTNSLRLCEGHWATGRWASANLGRNAAIVSSFYESGFDLAYAFRRGFESQGGRVVSSHVTHVPPDERGLWSTIFREIAELEVDFVSAFYSGEQADDFATAYRAARITTPLVGHGFTPKSRFHADCPVVYVSSWSQNTLHTYGRKASCGILDPFFVLGCETAGLIVAAHDATNGKGKEGRGLFEALCSAQIKGPRGVVSVDRETKHVSTPLYLHRQERLSTRPSTTVISSTGSSLGQDYSRLMQERRVRSGWMNPYPSV
jgi:ABC-type branched-subunit amino acid transport system substrate-binding protein